MFSINDINVNENDCVWYLYVVLSLLMVVWNATTDWLNDKH